MVSGDATRPLFVPPFRSAARYGYTAATFMALWLGCDFYEFFYHHLGHRLESFWAHHKHHHHFPNPTPFAVIADEYVDMFVRALPLLVFPLFVPINLDMMFFQFAVSNDSDSDFA